MEFSIKIIGFGCFLYGNPIKLIGLLYFNIGYPIINIDLRCFFKVEIKDEVKVEAKVVI